MTIDINNPDYAKALKEYESALYDATVEFERARRNAQDKFHDELRRIAEGVQIAEQPREEFTQEDIERIRRQYPVITPNTPIRWDYVPSTTSPYRVTCGVLKTDKV